jgi:hypothetical protein
MTLSIARRHAGTTARSRTFFGLFEHTRREGTKTQRQTVGIGAMGFLFFILFASSCFRVFAFNLLQ